MTVKYPDIHVQLTGEDGNAFAILATVIRALKQNKTGDHDEYYAEATSGDYSHLLRTTCMWVNVS